MAIHQDHPGLTVELVANSKPLQEYDNTSEETGPGEVTKYIEARSGMEFMVRYKFVAPFPDKKDVGYKVIVDGKRVKNSFFKRGELLKTGSFFTHGVTVGSDSKWVVQHFAFADLCMKNSSVCKVWDASENDMGLGTIEICLESGRAGAAGSTYRSYDGLPTHFDSSEKALKGRAIFHHIGRGTEHKVNPPKFASSWTDNRPIAVFNFKYRSLAALKALGIVPRTPSPSPTPDPASIPENPTPQRTLVPQGTPALFAPVSSPRQRTSALSASTDQDGLSTEELIVIVTGYRGHDRGLATQSRKALLSLLRHYESKDSESIQVTNDTGTANRHVRIKRERSDDSFAGGRQIKRKEREVIVLDD
ncbi:hypothetical protein HBI12_065300 [Parastagonospora nodorum]|nr:hypothetical protein HBI12_065300 [Parastagonospora nodorum]